jgi:Glycosyl transferase family 11
MPRSKRRRNKRNITRRKRQTGGEQKYLFIAMDNAKEGLGNQLYTYAAGLTVHKKTHLPICMIRDATERHSSNTYKDLFDGVVGSDLGILDERVKAAKEVISGRKTFYNKWNNTSMQYTSANHGKDLSLPKYLYQNYTSIKSVIPDMKSMLTKNEFGKEQYKKYNSMIEGNTAAFMHIRRGDYAQMNWLVDKEYYMQALDKLEENKGIKTLYIFSDDIGWCKEHADDWEKHTSKKLVYDETKNELEVLYMMMLCKAGAILSPSTFGSWGAFMGADMNESSTIIYKSLTENISDKKNLYDYPDRWIGI